MPSAEGGRGLRGWRPRLGEERVAEPHPAQRGDATGTTMGSTVWPRPAMNDAKSQIGPTAIRSAPPRGKTPAL